MSLYKKCIPTQFSKSVYEIDYEDLKQQGIKTLFFDLDNTLMSYEDDILPDNAVELLVSCQTHFDIVIISNSKKARVQKALTHIDLYYVYHAYKPLKGGFKKALKIHNNQKHEVILIGDQLMTDVFGANRFKIKSILVSPILRKSDIWTTRMNRKIEKRVIKKIQKKLPQIYEAVIKPYELS